MTESIELNPDEFQDQEKMRSIVRVLMQAIAAVPPEYGRDALWGALKALELELDKPLSPPSDATQH